MDEHRLRQLVRELLEEQRNTLQPRSGAFAATTPVPQIRVEAVSITSDRELMAFVDHVLELAKDGRLRAEIESRRHVFQLAKSPVDGGESRLTGPPRSPAGGEVEVAPVHFDRGLVSERNINAIAAGTTRLILGRRARLTPLARDRARQRGIRIERAKQ